MPVHDWTRVDDGIFHAFHLAWIAEMQRALNRGLLPAGYYALGEQVAIGMNPDILTLQRPPTEQNGPPPRTPTPGTVAVATTPPRVRLHQQAPREAYTKKQRSLVIRHRSGHRIVALIEIVSPSNKGGEYPLRQFVDKTLAALQQGIHVLLIDLFPPGPRDPRGLHGLIWEELSGEVYTPPADAPLTQVSYSAGDLKEAFVEPVGVGSPLAEMPLFLLPDEYIPLPLEATYRGAYEGVPDYYREILER